MYVEMLHVSELLRNCYYFFIFEDDRIYGEATNCLSLTVREGTPCQTKPHPLRLYPSCNSY